MKLDPEVAKERFVKLQSSITFKPFHHIFTQETRSCPPAKEITRDGAALQSPLKHVYKACTFDNLTVILSCFLHAVEPHGQSENCVN